MSNKYLNAISSADNNVFVDIEVSPNSNKFKFQVLMNGETGLKYVLSKFPKKARPIRKL